MIWRLLFEGNQPNPVLSPQRWTQKCGASCGALKRYGATLSHLVTPCHGCVNQALLLEEQEAYGATPMPRDSIKRQKKFLRSSSKRLRARLGRLDQYSPDPTMVPHVKLEPQSSAESLVAQDAVLPSSLPLGEPPALPSARRGSGSPPPAPTNAGSTSPRVFGRQGGAARELPSPVEHDADIFSRDVSCQPRRCLPIHSNPPRLQLAKQATVVRGTKLDTRRLSQERLQMYQDNFRGRLVTLADRYKALTTTVLPQVTHENAEAVVLQLFADGYYFCVLINTRLQQRGSKTIHLACA
jgi:hypothetical protein